MYLSLKTFGRYSPIDLFKNNNVLTNGSKKA